MMNELSLNKPKESLFELIKVAESPYSMGTNFHVYKRKRIPSWIEIGDVSYDVWMDFRKQLQLDFNWNEDDELFISQKFGFPESKHMNFIHLKAGITIYRNTNGYIVLAYDSDCDKEVLNGLRLRVKNVCLKNISHEIGFLQLASSRLHVRFCKYKPHEIDLIPYLGQPVTQFRNQLLKHINDENGNGLYLLHGKPGTGKTSFIKSILSQTNRNAIYLSAAMADKLTSPDIIGLLSDYPNTLLIIEDAETVLMKREADNSNSVSNLLNMSDGFPADFLNLCIICTFNTALKNVDPALLRKGRLRGILEFKPLSTESARQIINDLGLKSKHQPNKAVTLAELLNQSNDGNHYFNTAIGFCE